MVVTVPRARIIRLVRFVFRTITIERPAKERIEHSRVATPLTDLDTICGTATRSRELSNFQTGIILPCQMPLAHLAQFNMLAKHPLAPR